MTLITDTVREIDSRTNLGTTVVLSGYFDADGHCTYAIVSVESAEENFTLSEIPIGKALDVFRHPFFYSGRTDITRWKVA